MLSSLKVRIVFWYSLVFILTLLAVQLITAQAIRRLLHDELDASLRAETDWILHSVANARLYRLTDAQVRAELTSRSINNSRKEFIEIYDEKGNLFYRSPNVVAGGVLRPARSASDRALTLPAFGGRDVRLFSRADQGFQVTVAYPLTDIHAAMDKLRMAFIVLMPAALLLMAGGGIFLVSRFLRPIKGVSSYAEKLITQPLDEELPQLPGPPADEIAVLREQVHLAAERMRGSMRQVLSFSTLASHELRTPLTVMRQELEDALDADRTPEELRKAAASFYDETLRLSTIVDDLLSLGTMQAGTFRLNAESTPLLAMLRDFNEEARPLVRDQGVVIFLSGDPDLVARLDTSRMRQVLFNLLDNVVKHGGGNCRISLSCFRHDSSAVLCFGDDGRGIPEDGRARVFDPFYRGRGPSGNGTGLGLALVRGIVEAHGGRITLASAVGRGTTFRIELPASA
ncbi:MAG TPA: HAMP domain-containing sensor histidine kinase [Candidatus Eisenbacteria bacterium]